MNMITSENLAMLRSIQSRLQTHTESNNSNIMFYGREKIRERNKMLDAVRLKNNQYKAVLNKFNSNFELYYTNPDSPSTPYTTEDIEALKYGFEVKIKYLLTNYHNLSELTADKDILALSQKDIAKLENALEELVNYMIANS